MIIYNALMGRKRCLLLALSSLLLIAGCAHQQPVVYPASGAMRAPTGAKQAADICMARAKAYGLEYNATSSPVARHAAVLSAVPAARLPGPFTGTGNAVPWPAWPVVLRPGFCKGCSLMMRRRRFFGIL